MTQRHWHPFLASIKGAVDGFLVAQHPATHHGPFLVLVMYHTCLRTAGIFQYLARRPPKMFGNWWPSQLNQHQTMTDSRCPSLSPSKPVAKNGGLRHPFLRSFDLKVWSVIEDLERQISEVVMCCFRWFHVLQLLLAAFGMT